MPIDRVHLPPPLPLPPRTPSPLHSSPVPIARYPLTRGVSLTPSFRSRSPFCRPPHPSTPSCVRVHRIRPVPSIPPHPIPFHLIPSRPISTTLTSYPPIPLHRRPPTPAWRSADEPSPESPFHLCQIDYVSIRLPSPTDLNFSFSIRSPIRPYPDPPCFLLSSEQAEIYIGALCSLARDSTWAVRSSAAGRPADSRVRACTQTDTLTTVLHPHFHSHSDSHWDSHSHPRIPTPTATRTSNIDCINANSSSLVCSRNVHSFSRTFGSSQDPWLASGASESRRTYSRTESRERSVASHVSSESREVGR